MSSRDLQQALKNWQDKLAKFELERSITADAGQNFQLLKNIEQCEEEIEKLKRKLKTFGENNSSQPQTWQSNQPVQSFQPRSRSSASPTPFNSVWGLGIFVVVVLAVGVPTGIVLINQAPERPPTASLNADYSQLENLLKQKDWKQADRETFRLMLKVAKRESEGWLNLESIDYFPCPDLKKIDGLWVKYSNGRFGFSVQYSNKKEEEFKIEIYPKDVRKITHDPFNTESVLGTGTIDRRQSLFSRANNCKA